MTGEYSRPPETRTNITLVGGLVFAVGGTLAVVGQLWVAAGVVAATGLAMIVGARLWKK